MHINDLKSSKFLTRHDVGEGKLVTISRVHEYNVAKEGAPEEWKVCLDFEELDKPMVLNSTNAQLAARATGFENDIEKNWIGKQIVIYDDPSVSFGGKIVGGIRVRARNFTPQAAIAALAATTPKTDDLPF